VSGAPRPEAGSGNGGPHRKRSLALASLALGALIVILEVFVAPGGSVWWDRVFNAGHAPLFGVFAWIALWGMVRAWPARGWRRLGRYVAVFLLASAAGLGSEILQHFTGRDADLGDWARDMAGIVACLLLAAAFDAGLRLPARWRAPLRVALVLAALVPVGVVARPVVEVAAAYAARDEAFPLLFGFDASWEHYFYFIHYAEMSFEPLPAPYRRNPENRAAYLNLEPVDYAGLTLREPVPDWRKYRSLDFIMVSTRPDTIPLALRIDDTTVGKDWRRAGYVQFDLKPGMNTFRIPLEEIRRSPRARLLDMSRIQSITLFMVHIRHPVSLWWDDVRLEK
jgi:hypothetical protein